MSPGPNVLNTITTAMGSGRAAGLASAAAAAGRRVLVVDLADHGSAETTAVEDDSPRTSLPQATRNTVASLPLLSWVMTASTMPSSTSGCRPLGIFMLTGQTGCGGSLRHRDSTMDGALDSPAAGQGRAQLTPLCATATGSHYARRADIAGFPAPDSLGRYLPAARLVVSAAAVGARMVGASPFARNVVRM